MRGIHTPLYYALFSAFAVILLGITSIVHAIPKVDVDSGTLVAESASGDVVAMPLVSTDVDIHVTGPIARTSVHQTFQNDSDQWVEALYLFPLPENAAVDQMKLIIGDRVIEGDIQEKEEAKKTYEKAKREGYKAALVEQHRPNLFHTSVANIPPRGQISVQIEYQQSLLWRNKSFDLRFPLAITPRFTPATQQITEEADLSTGWEMLPNEVPQVLDIAGLSKPKTTIDVTLAPGFEVGELISTSHPINVTSRKNHQVMLTVGQDKSPLAPRDFVLRWAPTSLAMPKAAFFSEKHEKGYFGLVTLTPPESQAPQKIAREVIFVIDTSGSMNGDSMDAAKEAILAGVNDLESGDTFNIIQFDSEASAMFSDAVDVDVKSRTRAYRYINSLTADGGTNMQAALDLALTGKTSPGQRVRQVIFITDGSVGNETALFDQIRNDLGSTRLFTVGIGSAPNTYFMEESARVGRGTYTYIADLNFAEHAMKALFEKISKPALTNIKVVGFGVSDITPNNIPDLYAGEPLTVAMKLDPGVKRLTITGRLGDTEWRQTAVIDSIGHQAGIGIDWARKMIAQWQRAAFKGVEQKKVREEVLALALEHHLVSPYTSLVAVDVTPVRPATEGADSKAVPPTRPKGLEINLAKGATGYELSLAIAALLAALGALLVMAKREEA